MDEGPTKRTRRPSVRLHEPYYENLLGHRKPLRQWKSIKRRSDGAKKPQTAVHAKNKNDDVTKASKGINLDDDVAIGNWKNLNGNTDFKRKRVRPSGSNSRCAPEKSDDSQIQKLSSSSSGGKQGEEKQDDDDDGINSNLVVESSDPSCSFGKDDTNVDMNQGMEQRGMKNSLVWEGDVRIRGVDKKKKKNMHGVRAWLNKLGLQKYAPVFKIHEVDDEVLVELTLEDLRDMGINAVGSRRKMYASIQKLVKALS